jgi:hypothetical protein
MLEEIINNYLLEQQHLNDNTPENNHNNSNAEVVA